VRFLPLWNHLPAQRYVLVIDGEEFDAMAILRSARAHAGLDTTTAFRGDRRTVAEPLRALGFEVETSTPTQKAPSAPTPPPTSDVPHPEFTGPTDTWTVRACGCPKSCSPPLACRFAARTSPT
jgi:hypothetical protein